MHYVSATIRPGSDKHVLHSPSPVVYERGKLRWAGWGRSSAQPSHRRTCQWFIVSRLEIEGYRQQRQAPQTLAAMPCCSCSCEPQFPPPQARGPPPTSKNPSKQEPLKHQSTLIIVRTRWRRSSGASPSLKAERACSTEELCSRMICGQKRVGRGSRMSAFCQLGKRAGAGPRSCAAGQRKG